MSQGKVYKRNNSKYYWIVYFRNGQRFRESSKSTKKMVAERLLAQRMGDIAKGKVPGVYFDKVGFHQLAEDFLKDYELNQKKSLKRATLSVNHLNRFFGNHMVPQITSPAIQTYIVERLKSGASHASINRELSALKRMLNLGAQQTPPLVDRVPHIPMLKENNVRTGFFEYGEFLALREKCPEYLKGFITFAHSSGWRFSEITGLTWKQVDLEKRIVWLEAGTTKNGEARTLYLDNELVEVLEHQWEVRKGREVITPYVFPNRDGNGPIKDIRGSWFKACEEAGIGRRLFHDLRRTAVRNMVRSGTPEQVAMRVTGHKTRSVFDRYNITSDEDLRMAAQRQEEYRKSLTVTFTATVAHFPTKKGANRKG